MNRASLLAGLVLVLLTGVLALRPDPVVSPGSFPVALELPETLHAPPAPSTSQTPGFLAGGALLGLAALLLLAWRRQMGQSPGLALLPSLLLLAHPAMLGVVLSVAGRLDLAALVILLLGAALMASERTGKVAAGIVLLILSVLVAPSGGPFSALAAFVLLERVPAMQKGAVLLLMCGTARALGAPSALARYFEQSPAPGGWLLSKPLSVESILSTCAGLIPERPVVWLPGAEEPTVGLGLILVFVVGVVLLFPERRFGSRWVALLGLAALGLLVLSTGRGVPAGPAAIAAPLILLGCWLAGLADQVRQGPIRSVLAWSLGLGLLAVLGFRSFTQVGLFSSQTAFFRAVAAPDPTLAERGGLELAALRAELAHAAPDEVRAVGIRRLAEDRPTSATGAQIDRELAIALARSGWTEQALELIERAARGAGSDPELGASILLDQADLLLRAGAPGEALPKVDLLLSGAGDARRRAPLLARRGMIHAQLAFRGSADAAHAGDRDRELAAARRDFGDAIASDPNCARAHLDRGRFELALGEAIQALKSLEAATRLRPDAAGPRLELAKLYFSRGQSDAGERELAQASELAASNDPDVVLVTAQLQLARGDLPGAIRNAEWLSGRLHLLQGGSQSLSDLYRILALSAEDGRNLGVAEAMAGKCLQFGSDRDGGATACLLRILRQERRYDELVALLEQAEREATPVETLLSELSQALKNAGYAHFVAKDRAVAWNRFLDASRRSPGFVDLGAIPSLLHSMAEQQSETELVRLADEARRAFELGVSAIGAGDFAEARRLLQISIEMLPQNPFSYYHMGLALDRLGELDEARKAYELALQYAQALRQEELADRLRELLNP